MDYLPDLSVYALVDRSFDPTDGVGEARLRAVGWLDPQYSYPHSTDPPSEMLLDSLSFFAQPALGNLYSVFTCLDITVAVLPGCVRRSQPL